MKTSTRKSTVNGKAVTAQMQAAAIAWACDEITTEQLRTKLGASDVSRTIYRAGIVLREAVRSGRLGVGA